VLGSIVVGSSLYQHAIFEVGNGSPPPVPTAEEVSSSVERCLALKVAAEDIGEPLQLAYITYGFYFALYEINGQKIAIDLLSGETVPASDLKMGITPPEQYRQYREERESGSLGKGVQVIRHVPSKLMTDDAIYEEHRNYNNCGPTSGSMIVLYHRRDTYPDQHNYADFDEWAKCHSDPNDGTGGLYNTMKCNQPFPGVSPWDAGPGWIEYAESCGYNNFSSDEGEQGTLDSYEDIVSYIDQESPIMIMFQVGAPYLEGGLIPHWCALKGYEHDGTDYIWINDPRYFGGKKVNWGLNCNKVWLTYISPPKIVGETHEVNCDVLPGVTITLYKDSVEKWSTTSDNYGDYEIIAPELGDYTVEASKDGFRDESRVITVTDSQAVYERDFIGDYGLIPNAPTTPYVVRCIHSWLHPELGCVLSTSKVVAVINAWLYPIVGKGAEGGKIQPLAGISVRRLMFSSVYRGQTFPVWVKFTAPADDFNAIGLTDFAPEGWNVTVDATWSTPDANTVKAMDNKADIIWFGPYTENTAFTGVYMVTVPEDAPLGVYTFGDGLLEYYIGEAGPYTSEIGGASQVEVVG